MQRAHTNQNEMKTLMKLQALLKSLLSAHSAEVPIAENHSLSAFGRAGQNGFHARQQRDGSDLVRLGPFGAGDNQRVSGLQVRQVQSGHPFEHLLEVAGAPSSRTARWRTARWRAARRG